MRIGGRAAQKSIQAVGEVGIANVLKFFRPLVHRIPLELQLFNQKHLPQTMLSNGGSGNLPSFRCQFRTLIRRVLDPVQFCQFVEHSRDCCWCRSELFRNGLVGGNAALVLQFEYCFEVIFLANVTGSFHWDKNKYLSSPKQLHSSNCSEDMLAGHC